tara:strand:- start:865 stop:1332 length:468 start_codon:yes stop_codon:yes gene_type:complete
MAKFKEPIEYKIGDRVEVIRQGYSSIIIGIQESLAENRRNVYITEDGTRSWSNEIEYLEVSYTNQEMIDRIEKETSLLKNAAPSSVRDYNVGDSNYADFKIQPWDIWLEYGLNPWDADIVKRVLRDKESQSREMDYEKIIHICQERIRQIKKDID